MTNRKKLPRRPQISPHSGEGRQIGLDEREIPSGIPHLVNPETPAAKPKEIRAQPVIKFEGGVYDQDADAPYEKPEPGKIHVPAPVAESHEDYAVPVYMVEAPGKGKVRREAVAENITVAVAGSEPTRICGVDPERVQISLLNSTPAPVGGSATPAPIQFSEERATVVEKRGAWLINGATSYKTLKTQGELFALSTDPANPQQLSIIIETEVRAG